MMIIFIVIGLLPGRAPSLMRIISSGQFIGTAMANTLLPALANYSIFSTFTFQ